METKCNQVAQRINICVSDPPHFSRQVAYTCQPTTPLPPYTMDCRTRSTALLRIRLFTSLYLSLHPFAIARVVFKSQSALLTDMLTVTPSLLQIWIPLQERAQTALNPSYYRKINRMLKSQGRRFLLWALQLIPLIMMAARHPVRQNIPV